MLIYVMAYHVKFNQCRSSPQLHQHKQLKYSFYSFSFYKCTMYK